MNSMLGISFDQLRTIPNHSITPTNLVHCFWIMHLTSLYQKKFQNWDKVKTKWFH